jgi:hypothetical protein
MDIALENLFPVILIAVFIVRMILSARRPGKDARNAADRKQESAPVPVKKEKPEPGDFVPHWLEGEPAVKQAAPKKRRSLAEEFLSPENRDRSSPAAAVPRPAPESRDRSSPAAAVPAPESRAGRFPENLGYLPPLKQALVLGEILGPPKGLKG